MEEIKKRKLDESAGNGDASSEEQIRSLLDPLPKSQLVDLLSKLGAQYPTIAEEIKGIAKADPVHRKLFVRGLAWNTTSESLCAAFEVHGEIEEGAVIYDKATGKSRGYGFITYKNMESTKMALRAPSKMIDGRMAVCNLANEGLGGSSGTTDLIQRKLFIGGLSPEVTSEMLLEYFGRYGDIEEGSVAYDKETAQSRGFGFVTYKIPECAKRALDDPQKILGGRAVIVKYAESQRGKPGHYQAPSAGGGMGGAPMAPGYPPVGKGYPHADHGGYPPYPQVPTPYPVGAYPSPPAAAAPPPYGRQPHMPYGPGPMKKEPMGGFPQQNPQMGMGGGYPYYMPNQ
ncbi:hypothetical protein MLD38_020149 [Melastoma candidum]|uniref:Uncharacterized protein n=1 Tax=Melastoma candidum TaxID=119954 RepID=A0ACB9QBM5_9MYRT|nr:hypothetical protein MLD38_020149 [Melastoma candidum]